MRRKLTGMVSDGSVIDPRFAVIGLPSSKYFRFNADAGADGGNGGEGGGAAPDKAGDKSDPAKLEQELADIRAALKKANKEAADHRKKLDTYEQQEREKAEAEKSELVKAQERAAKLEADLNSARESMTQRDINDAIKEAARAAGFRDVADALQFIDRASLKLEDGKVSGAKEAIDALAKAKPYLLAGADDKKANPGTPKPGAKTPAKGEPQTNGARNPYARM